MNATQTLILHSVTAAMKAKRILGEHGIPVTVIKQTPGGGGGCRFAVSVPSSKANESTVILSSNGIPTEKRAN